MGSNGSRRRRRVGGERLVAKLEHAWVGNGPRRRHVPAPGPGGAGGVARSLELGRPLGLHPEAGAGAVGEVRVVPSGPARTQPASFQERADDVAAVADEVDRSALRVGVKGGREDERGLGRLLDAAPAPYERKRADALEHGPDSPCRLGTGKPGELRDRRLVRVDLTEVDEAG